MKNIIITGANAGIGLETAKALAKKGHRLILMVRTKDKGQRTIDLIKKETVNAQLDVEPVDLSVFTSIRSAVSAIKARHDTIDVLIHNAGLYQSKQIKNDVGIELSFMVNHIAPFYLTHLLMPLLIQSPESRIINVNSDSHFQAKLRPQNLNLDGRYHGLRAYAHSKLANALFTYAFHRKNPYAQLSIYALHPGLVNTQIGAKHASFLHRLVWDLRSKSGKTPEEGADTSIYLATADRNTLEPGKYYDQRRVKNSSKASYEVAIQDLLWEKSMQICGLENYF